MKRGWDRVNVYNLRILKDLTSLVDSTDNFKHICRAVTHLTDPKLAAGASEEVSSVRRETPDWRALSRCVPLIKIMSNHNTSIPGRDVQESTSRAAAASQLPAGPD